MREELGMYQKRTDYVVGIQKVEPGTEIYNELENVHYVTNADKCIVLTGTVGEQWPVTEAKLEKTYDVKNLLDRINAGEKVEAHPLPTADKIYAERADKETQVQTSWGDVLTAHEGDIIAYKVNDDGSVNRNDSWVINKDIFSTTYENAENKLLDCFRGAKTYKRCTCRRSTQ